MAYTLSQAVTETRRLINEDTAKYWSDTEIESWIAQGTLDWCHKSLLYTKQDTITVSDDNAWYGWSTNSYIDNAIRVMHARFNDVAMQRVTYEQIYSHNAMTLNSTGPPKYYFDIYDGNDLYVGIWPVPPTAQVGFDFYVTFSMRTDDITDLPWEYQPTIFLFAASKAKTKERQYQEAHIFYQQYINNIVFQRQDQLDRGIQTIDAFRIR